MCGPIFPGNWGKAAEQHPVTIKEGAAAGGSFQTGEDTMLALKPQRLAGEARNKEVKFLLQISLTFAWV